MKKHGQMIGSEILALALLLSLAGCLPGEEGPDAGNTQTGAAQSEPGTVEPAGYIPPEENRSFAASGMDCCPTEDGTGFYCPGTQILRYYDPAARDLITLCSILRIPVCMHNVPEEKIFRPAVWNAFGMDKEGQDFRACAAFGPMYK